MKKKKSESDALGYCQVPDVAKIEKVNKLEREETNWVKSQNTPVLYPHIVYGSRRSSKDWGQG
jgi:hypothetical protein